VALTTTPNTPQATQPTPCDAEPQLTVVVCITSADVDALMCCLEALRSGSSGVSLECIVPYDDRLRDVAKLAERFTWARFIDAREEINGERYGRFTHEHHHALRSVGLRIARGAVVAMLEDHGPPGPGWCRTVIEAHRKDDDAAVIGGAVENAVDRPLNWATYFCDFGRYQNPVPSGPVEYVTDVNISYKRDALLSVKPLWARAYHEPEVNWAIARQGGRLRLHPEIVTFQRRSNLRLSQSLIERFVWGRSFAGTRVTHIGATHRWALAVTSCLLPLVRTWRTARGVMRRRRFVGKFMTSLPLIALLETGWALGEFAGYVTGRPGGPAASDDAGAVEPCVPSPS
jgi:hypothetical protein